MMTRADKILIMLAIATIGGLYWQFWGHALISDEAEILVDGKAVVEAPLDIDRTYTVEGPLGQSQIEVKNGRIRFIRSPCTNKQCIHSGWLNQNGDFAACLPNHVSISLRGPDPRFDTINF